MTCRLSCLDQIAFITSSGCRARWCRLPKPVLPRRSKRAKAKGQPVLALRQERSIPSKKLLARLLMKWQGIAGADRLSLAASFAGLSDHILLKRVQDGVETGAFCTLLTTLEVGHLRIAGLDCNDCVAKTTFAARLRGYDVARPTKAVLSTDLEAASVTFKRLAKAGVPLA
ncbi:MAG: isochorismatase family protein [Pseudomonadota bacterium]